MADQWPGSVPRDQMLQRVVRRGKHIRLVRRLLIALTAAGVVGAGAAGYAVGSGGHLDVLGEATVPMADVSVPFHACPGSGPLGELHRGDRVLLTGTDESGRWLELRAPSDQSDRVWVLASAVTPDEDLDLPVVECGDDEATLALATGETVTTTTTETTVPGEETTTTTTTTAPATTTTTGPTTPGPTTTSTSTTAPDATPPVVQGLTRSPTAIYEAYDPNAGDPCPHQARTSQVTASVADNESAVVEVRLFWTIRLEGSVVDTGSALMAKVGPTTWQRTVGPFVDVLPGYNYNSGEAVFRVQAKNAAGRVSAEVAFPNSPLTIHDCHLG